MDRELEVVLGEVRAGCEKLLAGPATPLTDAISVGSGVYALFSVRPDKAIYVGETSDVRSRLSTHRSGRTAGDQMNVNLAQVPGFHEQAARRNLLSRLSVSLCPVNDAPSRLAIEAVLVALLRPPLDARVPLAAEDRLQELQRRLDAAT